MKKGKFRTAVAAALSATMLFAGAVGCGGTATSGDEPKVGTMNDLVKNFWENDTMYDETVILTAATNENGEIVSAPTGELLFEPTEILSVKQYFHADNAGIAEFTEGKDFVVSGKTITAKGEILADDEGKKTSFDTKMPYITDRQLTGKDIFPGLGSLDTGIPSKDGGFLPFSESYYVVQMQISVTYKHGGTWNGATPSYLGDKFRTALAKLQGKEDVNLLIFGESTSTGSNSSSVLKITPNLETWPEFVAHNLSSYFGANVKLTNKAVGGWTTVSGVSETENTGWVGGKQVSQKGLPALMREELKDYVPDIFILGFGLNDASLEVSKNTYAENMKKMIDVVLERNPDCAVIVLGTMLANPKALNQSKGEKEYSALNERIVSSFYADKQVATVDIGAMHQSLLDAGKKYIDITGNNVNHPNDFLARVYAMNVLSTFIR